MAAGIPAQTIEASANTQYTVGGVRMARPFKVRRLQRTLRRLPAPGMTAPASGLSLI